MEPSPDMITAGVLEMRRLLRDGILTHDSNIHMLRKLVTEVFRAMIREHR